MATVPEVAYVELGARRTRTHAGLHPRARLVPEVLALPARRLRGAGLPRHRGGPARLRQVRQAGLLPVHHGGHGRRGARGGADARRGEAHAGRALHGRADGALLRHPLPGASPSALVLTSPAGFEKFSWKEKAWFERVFSTVLIKSAPEYGIWGSVRQSNFMRWRPELEWLVEERVRVAKPRRTSTRTPTPTCARWRAGPRRLRARQPRAVPSPTLIVYGDG